MSIKARTDISTQAFAAEGMSTRIKTSDGKVGHLFQTYAAHEQSLGGLDKLCEVCGERSVFVGEFVLQGHRIRNIIVAIGG
jgi:hypothetical protein